MDDNLKVFSSNITRNDRALQNNLYDLIKVTPAVPIQGNLYKEEVCDFVPKMDKHYIPKKKSKLKVKTVRDIRNMYEKDVYSYLPSELEKQQSTLLKKITGGSTRHEVTKTLAKNILHCDKPISRSAWQMLMNVNPDGHTYNFQYVLWNGKLIRVNGSKGGKNKFLCRYDLGKHKMGGINKSRKKTLTKKKNGLLRNSLTVKFKPGPLSKKVCLDDSYQKYNVGNVELTNLPKPGFQISPHIGVALELKISNFVQNLRDNNGTICDKWAEFATSTLSSIHNQEIVQTETDCITFDLSYRCEQKRLLMRRDIDNKANMNMDKVDIIENSISEESLKSEIKSVVEKILDAVEINILQDNLYKEEDKSIQEIEQNEDSINILSTAPAKDRHLQKKCGELHRLDVTVIRLPEEPEEEETSQKCSNAYCTLGCVCASLQCIYNLKQHCGRIECMFRCKCDFSNYKISGTMENSSDLLPGLLNINNNISLRLAKEEKKFHQTVLVTGNQKIFLKTKRRNWKSSKRYADFYSNMCLKTDMTAQPILSIVGVNIDCDNVAPWCMVHNLYKCFCKGKFTETASSAKDIQENDVNETSCQETRENYNNEDGSVEQKILKRKISDNMTSDNYSNRNSLSGSTDTIQEDISNSFDKSTCSRTKPYDGRKYNDSYYFKTNKKISDLEKNDDKLRSRLLSLTSIENCEVTNQTTPLQCKDDKIKQNSDSCVNTSGKVLSNFESKERNHIYMKKNEIKVPVNRDDMKESIAEAIKKGETNLKSSSSMKLTTSQFCLDSHAMTSKDMQSGPAKSKLIAWLESSYKLYKQRLNQGIIKVTLDPPKHGKVALYPWNFILSRYRERKNLFLISKQRPFRIFMAVDAKDQFFANCINIDDIRFADLHKYPITIKNLLTNATDDTKENFCILCGLSICWEVIGSVAKVKEQTVDLTEQTPSTSKDLSGSDDSDGFTSQYSTELMSTPVSSLQDKKSDRNRFGETASLMKPKKKSKKKKIKSIKPKIKNTYTNTVKSLVPGNESAINISNVNDNTDTEKLTIVDQITNRSDLGDDIENVINATTIQTQSNEHNKVSPNSQPINNKSCGIDIATFQEIHKAPESEANMDNTKFSRWFVMTVENDFIEIQFFKKGFFVKHDSIIKAIQVARMSKKTVRLSAQKCADNISSPQFGIYATPNENEYCVFIGPYNKEETLGIETVKSLKHIGNNNPTRGYWLTVNKSDDIKVIETPLSFLEQQQANDSKEIKLVSSQPIETDNIKCTGNLEKTSKKVFALTQNEPLSQDNSIINSPPKLVKPIKIKKTDGFYHLAPKDLRFKQLQQQNSPSLGAPSLIIENFSVTSGPSVLPTVNIPQPPPLLKTSTVTSRDIVHRPVYTIVENKKPVAEIAPQIKILNVFSQSTAATAQPIKKYERGMFILKPEEINKRILINKNVSEMPSTTSQSKSDQDQDLENFLATSTECILPYADIFEISDEEDNGSPGNDWKDVWIQCENVESLGLIKGRKNSENNLSFEFPGFKYTDFYPEEEAFSKINKVFSRKIYVPKNISMQWRVVESEADLKTKHFLKSTDLGIDFVLTKRGLRHKRDLIASSFSKNVKPIGKNKQNIGYAPVVKTISADEVDKAVDMMSDLDEQSRTLEEEGDLLMNQMSKTSELIQTIDINAIPGSHQQWRDGIAETLKVILATNDVDGIS